MRDPWIAFLLRHCLAGVLAGWLVVAGLLWLDVAGLSSLIFGSDAWPLPLGMLLFGFSITFGSVAMGAAIMALGRSDGPAEGRRPRAQPAAAEPAPVLSLAARRR